MYYQILWRKLRRAACYGGLTREEYERCLPAITEANRRTLLIASFVAAMLLAVLSVVSFVPGLQLAMNRPIYVSFFLFFLLCGISALLMKNSPSGPVLRLCYLAMFGAFLMGILLSNMDYLELPAVTFCVLLFAMPTLLVDKPYRIALLIVVVDVIFIAFDAAFKSSYVFANRDLINAVCFGLLGILMGYHIQKVKIKEHSMRRQIERERDTDGLTGLLNKECARRRIQAHVNDEAAAVLLFDVDDFKSVNDTYGHIFGDAVLRALGRTVRDVFDDTYILSRFGGDEFSIFLPGEHDRAAIEAMVDRFNERLSAAFAGGGMAGRITCSFGCARYPQDADDLATLYQNADKALYLSKQHGKNRLSFFQPSGGAAEYP